MQEPSYDLLIILIIISKKTTPQSENASEWSHHIHISIYFILKTYSNEQNRNSTIHFIGSWRDIPGYLLSVAIHLDSFSCNLNFPGLAFSNYGLAIFSWGNSRKSTSPIFISQTTDFHFAYKRFSFRNCRFSFRKLQHFVSPVSQSTPSLDLQARRKKWEPPLIHSKQAPPEIDINSK